MSGRTAPPSRRVAVLAGAVLWLGPAVFGGTGLWLAVVFLGACLACAAALAPDRKPGTQRLGLAAWLPLAALLVTAVVVVLGLIGGWLGIGLWSSRIGTLLLCSVLAAACAVSAWRRSPHLTVFGIDRGPTIVGLVLGCAFIALALVQPLSLWSRHVGGGTDFARHVQLLQQTIGAGNLEYSGGGYPSGVHAIVGVLWQAAGGSRFADAWVALESFTWTLLWLMILAIMITTARLVRLLSAPGWVATWLAPVLAASVLIQGMWFASMLEAGYVTGIAAGLAVAAILIPATAPGENGTLGAIVALTAATVVLANTWTLLAPLGAAAVALALASAWRTGKRPGISLGIVLVGLVASLPVGLGLLGLLATDEPLTSGRTYAEEIAAPAPITLWYPEWWWWAAALVAAVAVIALRRRSPSSAFPITWTVLAGVGVLTVVVVAPLTGATWAEPGYYPLKTGWILSNLVVAPALAGGLWLTTGLARAAGSSESSVQRIAGVTGLLAVVVMGGAVLAANYAVSGTATINGFRWGFGHVAFQLPVLDHLESHSIRIPPDGAVLTYGVVPYGSVTTVGAKTPIDRYVDESLRWLEPTRRTLHPTVSATRDAVLACEFLRQNPGALRVTGPSDEPGIGWLRDAGCPADVIRADEWIRVPIAGEWFAALPFEGQPYRYPTWTEYRDLMRQQLPGWPEAASPAIAG